MLLEPDGKGMQIVGVGTEGAHDLGVIRARNTGHNFVGTNIHPGGMGLDAAQPAKGRISASWRLGLPSLLIVRLLEMMCQAQSPGKDSLLIGVIGVALPPKLPVDKPS
jgi:hypothetical protein